MLQVLLDIIEMWLSPDPTDKAVRDGFQSVGVALRASQYLPRRGLMVYQRFSSPAAMSSLVQKIPSLQKLKTNSIVIRRGELQSCNNFVTIYVGSEHDKVNNISIIYVVTIVRRTDAETNE
ncbi:hypothetical protein YC2023_010458 [Brassica napus]